MRFRKDKATLTFRFASPYLFLFVPKPYRLMPRRKHSRTAGPGILFSFTLFFDNGAAQLMQAVAQLIQPLLHAQQQVPAQYYREAKIANCFEYFLRIH